jgi:short-subunit dehydrogenase
MMAMPTMALYSASKFALEGATESLWYEMRPFGIKVSLIEPGFVHSSSFQNTRYTMRARLSFEHPRDPYPNYYRAMSAFIAHRMEHARATPAYVAKIVHATLEKRDPPLRVRATADAKLFEFFRRFFPRQLYHRILYAALPERRTWGVPPAGDVSPAQRRDRAAEPAGRG